MTTNETPTPAQKHIEVLRSMLGGYNHDIEFEPHYNALLAALAALEAVERARKRFIVWGGAEGYVTDDEDDAEFARCGFRATASTSLLAEAVRESFADGADDEETELHCETVLIIPAAAVEVKS